MKQPDFYQLWNVERADTDDERCRGRQNFDQGRRKDRDEDVGVSHRVEEGHQGHAAVGQPGERRRVEEQLVLGQSGHQEQQHVVDAELLEQERHAIAGHRDRRVGRRMDEQLVGGPQAEPDRASALVRNVN